MSEDKVWPAITGREGGRQRGRNGERRGEGGEGEGGREGGRESKIDRQRERDRLKERESVVWPSVISRDMCVDSVWPKVIHDRLRTLHPEP